MTESGSRLVSAFSSILDSTVVTYRDQRSRAVDISKIFNYDYVTGPIGDKPSQVTEAAPTGRIKISVTSSGSRKTESIVVGEDDSVADVLDKIPDDLKFIDGVYEAQSGLYSNYHCLDVNSKISECGIEEGATLNLYKPMWGGADIPRYYIDESLLDRKYDYDFTDKKDDGTEFYRGERRYHPPYGWMRHALKVRDKYDNNTWLGEDGISLREHSSEGEWAVSYHGTNVNVSGSIAEEGYRLSKGKRFMYGKGIYSTPSIEVAALFATKFQHEEKTYQIVFQNRVSPVGLVVIRSADTGRGEYWMQPDEKFIRPYAICTRQLVKEGTSSSQWSWWCPFM